MQLRRSKVKVEVLTEGSRKMGNGDKKEERGDGKEFQKEMT